MSVDNALDDGQPDPRALKIVSAVESLKNTEELVCVLHIKTNSIVLDVVNVVILLNRSPYLNDSGLHRSRKFHGIRQEVRKDLANHRRIPPCRGEGLDLQLEGVHWIQEFQFVKDSRGHLSHIDAQGLDFLMPQAREGKKSVNQLEHLLGVRMDLVQKFLSFSIHLPVTAAMAFAYVIS